MVNAWLEESTQLPLTCLDQTLQGHVHLKVEFSGKKSVKPFSLEKCLYGSLFKLKLFCQGRGTMSVLTVTGEDFSVQARICYENEEKTPTTR